jgi:hypothetical protein
VPSSGGDIKSIQTRDPADDVHEENLADVLGQKPVALLMATPALCQTRVGGPVTDIAAQFQEEFGDRVTFTHQEVYEDNVQKGLRAPLREFGLRTEPWLFTFNADGRVVARLEGWLETGVLAGARGRAGRWSMTELRPVDRIRREAGRAGRVRIQSGNSR